MIEEALESAKRSHRLARVESPAVKRGEQVVNAFVEAAEGYLRANPWLAVAGAAVATRIFTGLSQGTPIRRQSSRAAVRDWLDDAYDGLPTRKQFKSAAKSAGVPSSFGELKEKVEGLALNRSDR